MTNDQAPMTKAMPNASMPNVTIEHARVPRLGI